MVLVLGRKGRIHRKRRDVCATRERDILNRFLAVVIAAALICTSTQVGTHSSSHASANHRSKTVYVHGYTTKSGRHVHGYYRRYPRRAAARAHAGGHRSARREKRSKAAVDAFKRENPCPYTGKRSGPCRGYVIDHIKPLACGGADDPSNMQWQTIAAGKVKDKWERRGCR